MATAVHPDVFFGVECEHGVAGAGEEEMLHIHIGGKIGIREIDLDGVRAVAVIDEHIRMGVGRDVIVFAERPLVVPPAGDDAHLEPVVVREGDVERLGLQFLPDICRELGDGFVVRVGALQREAVRAVPIGPADSVRIGILPDDGLLGLPVTALSSRLVVQFRHEELFAVVGVNLTHVGAFEHFLGDRDDDGALTLAVESEFIDDHRVAVGIKQFDLFDELQVLTINGQLLAAGDLLAFQLGETGHDG